MNTGSALKAGLASIVLALVATHATAHPNHRFDGHHGHTDRYRHHDSHHRHHHHHDGRFERQHRIDQAHERSGHLHGRQPRHDDHTDRHYESRYPQHRGAVVIVPPSAGGHTHH